MTPYLLWVLQRWRPFIPSPKTLSVWGALSAVFVSYSTTLSIVVKCWVWISITQAFLVFDTLAGNLVESSWDPSVGLLKPPYSVWIAVFDLIFTKVMSRPPIGYRGIDSRGSNFDQLPATRIIFILGVYRYYYQHIMPFTFKCRLHRDFWLNSHESYVCLT